MTRLTIRLLIMADGHTYNMTDKDYEPYVVSDAVHIGWKGWVDIAERIEQHMHKK
jgi:D-alanine transfer protein